MIRMKHVMKATVRGRATALLLAVMVALASLIALPRIGARAEEDKDSFSQFLTSITLTVRQADGNDKTITLSKDSPDPSETLEIKNSTTVGILMNFDLGHNPNDYEHPGAHVAGHKYTMDLPAALALVKDESGFLVIGNNVNVGTWSIDQGGALTIQFSPEGSGDADDADDYDNRTGYVEASSTFQKSKLGDDETAIKFNIGGNTVTLPVEVITSEVIAPTIEKEAVKGKISKDGIQWKVTVESGNDGDDHGLTEVVVTDTLGGQEVKDSGEHAFDGTKKVYWKVAGTPQVGSKPADEVREKTDEDEDMSTPYYTVSDDSKTITFHLGDMEPNKTGTLTFYSKPENSQSPLVFPATKREYYNNATLGAKIDNTEIDELDIEAHTPITEINSWIKKGVTEGGITYYDESQRPKTITWTVTLNPDGKGIIPAGATVTDTLQTGLSVQDGSIKVGENFIKSDSSATDPYYSLDGQKLTVNFPTKINTETKLTFTTTVAEDFYNTNQNISNTATLHSDYGGNGDKTQNGGTGNVVTSTVISKDPGDVSYDPATHLAHWKIEVNHNKIAITNPVVTDTIPVGQKFISVSIGAQKLTDNRENKPYYVLKQDSKKQDSVEIHLKDFSKDDPNAPVTLDLVTEVTDPAVYAGNKAHSKTDSTIKNSVKLTSDNKVEGTDGAEQPAPSQVLDKTATAYNAASKTIAWDITVNQNRMAMTNPVVTDTLPEGLTVQAITMDGKNITQGAESVNKPYYTLDRTALKIYLSDLALNEKTQKAETKTIHIVTKISDDFLAANNGDEHGQIKFTNKASLAFSDDNDTHDIPEISADETINHTVIEKSGSFDKATNEIKWQVKINKNQIPAEALLKAGATSITLTDTLPEGLELDPESVTLYKISMAGGETRTKGDPIPLEDGNVNVLVDPTDPQQQVFVFTFPQGTELFTSTDAANYPHSYELDFSTYITKDPGKDTTYTNQISFDGTINSTNSQFVLEIFASDANAGFSGTLPGKAVVTKIDKDDPKTTLAGAEFSLYKVTGDTEQYLLSKPTGDDGKATFKYLKDGSTYVIKETKAPENYNLDATPYKFIVNGENNTDLSGDSTFEDTKKPENPGGNSSTPGGPGDGGSSTPSSSAPSSSTPGGGDDNPGGGGGDDTSSSSTPSSSVPAPSVPGGGTTSGGTAPGGPAEGGNVPGGTAPGGSAGGGNVGEGTAHGGTGKGKPSAGPQTGDAGSPMIPMLAAVLAAAAAVFTGNLILARRAKKSKKS